MNIFYNPKPVIITATRKSPFRQCGEFKAVCTGKDNWYYITDDVDYNCLAFTDCPAKFTDKESAEAIAIKWNQERI